MKFNKEQIKDLIYLKQNSCKGRSCGPCQWNQLEIREFSCFFQNQPEWEKPIGKIRSFETTKRIQQVATIVLKEIIFEEPE